MRKTLSVVALTVFAAALMTISPFLCAIEGNGQTTNGTSNPSPLSNVGLVDGDPLFAKLSTTLQTRANPSCMAVADLNNDDLLDIAVGYSNNKSLDIFFQTQSGNFTLRSPGMTLPSPVSSLATGDMDNDGQADLILGYDRYVVILYQASSFSVAGEWIRTVTYKVHGLSIADFDKNGRSDIAVLHTRDTSIETAKIDMLYEDGSGDYYTEFSSSIPGMDRPRSISLGDFDNNGFIDIVVADENKGIVAPYINDNASQEWDAAPQISISEPVGIKIGKFDSSNLFELAIASRGTFTNHVEIWKFTSPTAPFISIKTTTNVDGVNGFIDYDMNDDPYRDIAISSNSSSRISIFNSPANPGTAYPSTTQAIIPAGYEIISMLGSDINHDNVEDLVVSSKSYGINGSISIYYRVGSGISNANDNVFPSATNQSGLVTGDYNADGRIEVGTLDNTARRLVFVETTSLIASYKTFDYSASRIVSGPLKTPTSSDIVVLHPDDNKISIYLGGSSFFSSQAPSLVISTGANAPRSVALGDVNGDGRTDIVIGCHDGILILNNTGSNPYFASNKNITISQPGADFIWVGVGDYNNGAEENEQAPKLNDIFGAYQDLNRVIIYFQQDQPVRFTPINNLILVPATTGKIVWAGTGHINNDGLSDIVIGLSTNRSVTYLQNNAYSKGFSNSSATDKVNIPSPYGFRYASIGDLNDDGLDELAIAGSKVNVITVFGWKQGRYVPFTNMTTGAGRAVCLVSDLDGDKRSDLIASSEGSGSISFLYQRNMAPKAGFSIMPVSPHETEITTFDASSTTDGISDMSSISYAWLFDGTIVKTGKTVTHSFMFNSHFRTHTVKLTVQDRNGLSNVSSQVVMVEDVKPVANFYFNPSSPIEAQQIHFTDASSSVTDTIIQWLWDFGDGSPSSTDRNPVHTFYFNHSYAVKLRVIEADGSMENCTKIVNMTDRPPQVSFITTGTMVENSSVSFTDASNSFDDTILWREWDFGDGTAKVNTSLATVSHKFHYSGAYSVTLRIGDDDHAINRTVKLLSIADILPTANFNPNVLTILENGTVHFTDRSTTYYKDHIVEWSWSFGDGSSAITHNPDHRYQYNGSYQVNLTVRCNDSSSWSAVHSTTIIVEDIPPASNFIVNDLSPLENVTVSFVDTSSHYDPIISWHWDFGDGSFSTTQNPTHKFLRNGTYQVILTVTDSDQVASSPKTVNIVVQDLNPTALIEIPWGANLEGDSIQFFDRSFSYDPIDKWSWDFGDGFSSNDRDPVHTYRHYGTYQVTLKVWDGDNHSASSTYTVEITIQDRDPRASFDFTTGRYENTTVWFNETANPWFDHIDNWTWDFGDGSAVVYTRNASHIYSQNGTYTVKLTVVDNNSKTNMVASSVTVLDCTPILIFSFPEGVYENETGWVNFFSACYSLYPSGDPIVYWEWDFGDGIKNLSQAASHLFPLAGDHSVTLRVRDLDDRHTTNLTKTIHVISLVPTAAIMPIEGDWIEDDNVVHFTDLSTAYRLDPIVQWSWDFGDGSSSSDRNPDHSYQWAGTYVVGLTVTDLDGDHSTRTTATVRIGHAIPTASVLVITPRPYVVGDTVTFQSTSTASPDHIARLLWESDGDSGDQSVFRHQFNANSNFWVKLTVWSNDSIENTTTAFVNLEPSDVSIGTADGSTNNLYVEDTAVTFVVAATRSPTDPIVSYVWDLSFGTGFVAQPPRTENSITWHFNQSGSYLVKVRVYDTDGYTEAHRQINIFESDPTPAFNCGNLNSEGPVWFNANQTHDTPSDVSLLRFRWNYGDSSPWSEWSSDATTSHNYPGDGNYTTIMQVKDDSGKIVALTRSVVVDRSPPKIEISSPISKAYIGDPIFVYANVTDLIGVEKVVLIYTVGNQTFEVEMTRANQAGSFVAEIPAQNRSVNLSYAISAVDVSGMQSPLSQSFQIVLSQRPTLDMMWAFAVLLMSIVSALLVVAFVTKPVVDEVFVIYHDGSLLSHHTRHLKPSMDDQILGSMLIALQSFVKDSFKDESMTDLKRMEFGDKRILVEREGPIFLAVILRGKRDGKATREMKYSLDGINHRFGEMLNPWDGDLEKVRGVKDMVKPLVKRKGLFRDK